MEVCYLDFSFYSFLHAISSNFIKLRYFSLFSSNSRNRINTKLKFLVPLSIRRVILASALEWRQFENIITVTFYPGIDLF